MEKKITDDFISLQHIITSDISRCDEQISSIKVLSIKNAGLFLISTIIPIIIGLYTTLQSYIISLSPQISNLQSFMFLGFSLILAAWLLINLLTLRIDKSLHRNDRIPQLISNLKADWGKVYSRAIIAPLIIMFYVALLPYLYQIYALLIRGTPFFSVIRPTAVQIVIFVISILLLIPSSLYNRALRALLQHNEDAIRNSVFNPKILVGTYNQVKGIFNPQEGGTTKLYVANVLIVIYMVYFLFSAYPYYNQYFLNIELIYAIIFEISLITAISCLILWFASLNRANVAKAQLNATKVILTELDKKVATILRGSNNDQQLDYAKEHEEISKRYAEVKVPHIEEISLPFIFRFIHLYYIRAI